MYYSVECLLPLEVTVTCTLRKAALSANRHCPDGSEVSWHFGTSTEVSYPNFVVNVTLGLPAFLSRECHLLLFTKQKPPAVNRQIWLLHYFIEDSFAKCWLARSELAICDVYDEKWNGILTFGLSCVQREKLFLQTCQGDYFKDDNPQLGDDSWQVWVTMPHDDRYYKEMKCITILQKTFGLCITPIFRSKTLLPLRH